MTMLAVSHHQTQGGLVTTSKPKEVYQIFQEFSDRVKIMADDLKRIAGSKDGLSKVIVAAVDLRALAERADRDAARRMEVVESDLDFWPVS